jgi:hypothetical protein
MRYLFNSAYGQHSTIRIHDTPECRVGAALLGYDVMDFSTNYTGAWGQNSTPEQCAACQESIHYEHYSQEEGDNDELSSVRGAGD